MDLGAGRRGVDMGPSAIRYAMLKEKLMQMGFEVEDMGNLHVPSPETYQVVDPKLKYLEEIASVCETLAQDRIRDGGAGALSPGVGGRSQHRHRHHRRCRQASEAAGAHLVRCPR